MANYPLPKQFHPDFAVPGRKPVGGMEVDRSHPIGQHVAYAFVPQHNLVDLIHGPLDLTGSVSYESDYIDFTMASGDALSYDSGVEPSNEITVIFRCKRGNASATEGVFSDKSVANWATDNGISINFRTDDKRITWKVGSDEAVPTSGWSTLNTTGFYNVCCTYNKNGSLKIYVDGEEPGSYATQDTPGAWGKSSTNVRIANYYDNNYPFSGDLVYLYVIRKELNQDQIRAFHRDPYQILRPSTPMFHFTSAGDTGTTVNGTLGTVDVTANAATVNNQLAITATKPSVNVSTYTATVSLGTNISATVSGVDVTSYAATVNDATAINATLANANVTAYQAGITEGAQTNISASLGAIDVSTLQATVTQPTTNVFASVGGLTVTGYQATVSYTGESINAGGFSRGDYDFLNPPTKREVKAAKTIQRVAKKQIEREAKKGKPAPKTFQYSELRRALKKQQIELDEDHKKQLETARDQAIDDAIQQQLILQEIITNEKQHQLDQEQEDIQIMLMMLSSL